MVIEILDSTIKMALEHMGAGSYSDTSYWFEAFNNAVLEVDGSYGLCYEWIVASDFPTEDYTEEEIQYEFLDDVCFRLFETKENYDNPYIQSLELS